MKQDLFLFSFEMENFSKNLFGSSFEINNLKKIKIGESIIKTSPKILYKRNINYF